MRETAGRMPTGLSATVNNSTEKCEAVHYKLATQESKKTKEKLKSILLVGLGEKDRSSLVLQIHHS